MHPSFDKRVAAAFRDPYLRTTLTRSTGLLRRMRREAFAGTADFRDLQAAARAVRQRTLDDLDGLLQQFEARAESQGVVLHWAEDAAAASRIVVSLARERNVQRIVKTRSATCEEIGLRPELEAAGFSVTETQVGDYILQLDGDAPSHAVYPALHRRKEDVAALFEAKLDMPETLNVQAMASMARFKLRRELLQADMSISGVNFAVAETGTLALAMSTGNGRLAMSMAPIHVAVMGIEKVVPTVEDLLLLLQVLARSAGTGAITSYVHLINGPARTDHAYGPEALHVVIMDNGRSQLLRGAYRDTLACIRCGACMSACPVYREIGGQAYGGPVMGPIGSVVLPLMPAPPPLPQASQPQAGRTWRQPRPTPPRPARQSLHGTPFAELPRASSLCGACRDVCPVGIDIPGLLVQLRGDLSDQRPAALRSRLGRTMFAWATRDAARYRLATRLLRIGLRLLGRARIRRLPPPWRGWTTGRDFPVPAARSFREAWEARGG